MMEQGHELTPDPAAPDTAIQPPTIHCSLHPTDSVTGSMTPQQVKDRRGQQDSHKALLPAAPVTGDVTQQQQRGSMQRLDLLDLDMPRHLVLDDIDMTLRRKQRQKRGWARPAGYRTVHRPATIGVSSTDSFLAERQRDKWEYGAYRWTPGIAVDVAN